MTTIDRRHRGREIRKARRLNGPGAGVVFVDIALDDTAFFRAFARAARAFGELERAYYYRRPLIHNGRKS